MTEVVGIGSCAVDFIAQVARLLGPDEKINVDTLKKHPGGVTANNLTQVARLGVRAGWIGLIGDDDNGLYILKEFSDDGMDLSGIEIMKGELSSLAWIPLDSLGERSIYMFPNVTAKLTQSHVRNHFAAHIQNAKHFHTEASQLPLPPIVEGMQIARDAGVLVLFDLDLAPKFFEEAHLGSREDLAASLKLVDVLKPCKAAAFELTGESDLEKMARGLLKLGPKLVAITMGPEGCLIASSDQMVHVPAFKVDIVDTTGAGDAFMGGLSFGLLQKWDYLRIGLFANACAALCCTKVGARSMPKYHEVLALCNSEEVIYAKKKQVADRH